MLYPTLYELIWFITLFNLEPYFAGFGHPHTIDMMFKYYLTLVLSLILNRETIYNWLPFPKISTETPTIPLSTATGSGECILDNIDLYNSTMKQY